MTATIPRFLAILDAHGTLVTYHKESAGVACPCRTPEGFRDLAWHKANPLAPMCNENGMLAAVDEFTVKASVQPVSAGGARRTRTSERVEALFPDEIRSDDHIGIFPVTWQGHTLDFFDFGDTGDDYILYDDRRFVVIAADKMPDTDGDPNHHWELGLRLVTTERASA